MNISVVMVIKNEEKIIRDSISRASKFAKEIIVVDTGSSDETKNILLSEFNIVAIDFVPPLVDQFSIVEARNFALGMATSDWIMILDADELVDYKSIEFLKRLSNEQEVDSFFGNWLNFDNCGNFWDYKVFLFKRSLNLKYLGKCHSVPQSWLRENSKEAKFLNDLNVIHNKDITKTHRLNYFNQMEVGIKENPSWIRYHWFMGYALTKMDRSSGKEYLNRAANSFSELFPVECLNANLCLIEMLIQESQFIEARLRFLNAYFFWNKVKDDFEVKINPFTEWFEYIDEKISNQENQNIKMRSFGH